MKRRSYYWLLAVAAISLGGTGCSSSKTVSDDEEIDTAEVADAGTDAAPQDADQLASAPSDDAKADDVDNVDTHSATQSDSLAAAPEEPAPRSIEDSAVSAPVVAETRPSTPAEPSATETLTGTGEFDSYTVKAGDTLMRIAFETYGDLFQWKQIYEANRAKISDPNNLPKGLVLKLERMNGASGGALAKNGEKYLIKSGDTLGTISDDIYGTPRKWRKLYEFNRDLIKDPNRIFAGFYLYYSITADEREEAERRKQERVTTPLAGQQSDTRNPASNGVAK